ncbi:MAG TPA: EfeM/EfeO family lipoprotein [Streptosporangiaceae bacterium]
MAGATIGLLAAGPLAGCTGSPGAENATRAKNVITVSGTTCGSGWPDPSPGVQTLQIHNTSAVVVEVTLVSSSTGAIYARVEGIGPRTTRAMPVDVGSGSYAFECHGNNYGYRVSRAIRIPGHVRGGAGIMPVTAPSMNTVTAKSEAYVARGLAVVARLTRVLAAQIRAGDLAAARAAWLPAHLAWERLGSAYGMFSSFDAEIDGTPFGLRGGVHSPAFTGFYRLEYGLWHGQSAAELTGPAEQLAVAVHELSTSWIGMALPPDQALGDLALRTHEILEHAMRFQLSGQADFGSGTTMASAAANIDATLAQLEILHPLLVTRYRGLPALYRWLDRLRRLVNQAETSHGWIPVSRLSTTRRQQIDAAAGQALELLDPIPVMFEAERPIP